MNNKIKHMACIAAMTVATFSIIFSCFHIFNENDVVFHATSTLINGFLFKQLWEIERQLTNDEQR